MATRCISGIAGRVRGSHLAMASILTACLGAARVAAGTTDGLAFRLGPGSRDGGSFNSQLVAGGQRQGQSEQGKVSKREGHDRGGVRSPERSTAISL